MKNRINFSEKREAIHSVLRENKEHPSAEYIYGTLKPRFTRLSLGTVYRNLQGFKKEGTVRSLAVVDGQERFDGNTTEHAHFICDKCGAVTDLDIPLPDEIGASVRQDGYQIDVRLLFIRGLCPNCTEKSSGA